MRRADFSAAICSGVSELLRCVDRCLHLVRDRGSTLRLADDLAAFVRRVEPAAHKAVLLHAADDTRHRRVRHLQEPFDLLLRRLTAVAVQITQHAALRKRQPLLREIGICPHFDLIRDHF